MSINKTLLAMALGLTLAACSSTANNGAANNLPPPNDSGMNYASPDANPGGPPVTTSSTGMAHSGSAASGAGNSASAASDKQGTASGK